MKKAILNPITFFLAVIAASLASCATETYADKRKAEKAAFDNYRQRNNLEFSTDSAYCFSLPAPWPENLYFQTHRGAYVRLIKHDPEARPVAEGTTCVMRYNSYNMDDIQVGGNTGTREGEVFVFTPGGSDPCSGWNDAAACLRHGSEAMLLIDSQLGPSDQYQAVETIRMEIVDFTVRN